MYWGELLGDYQLDWKVETVPQVLVENYKHSFSPFFAQVVLQNVNNFFSGRVSYKNWECNIMSWNLVSNKKKTRATANKAPPVVAQEELNYLPQTFDEFLKRKQKKKKIAELRESMFVHDSGSAHESINILSELIKWWEYEPDQ